MGKLVWIASYPKSGNTWMRAFLWNYLRNPDNRRPLDDLSRFAVSESYPDFYRPYAQGGDLANLSVDQAAMLRQQVHAQIGASSINTVFVKAHNYMGSYNDFQLYNLELTAGAIYIVRNPLDVVISVADHFGVDLDEAIDFMANEETASPLTEVGVPEFYASWSTHVASWTEKKHPNILVVRYEDLLERPRKFFLAALKLINQANNPARFKAALQASSFRQLKTMEERDGFQERSHHSARFFRVGRRDQWRDKLSSEQVERIVSRHAVQMDRFGYIPASYRRAAAHGRAG